MDHSSGSSPGSAVLWTTQTSTKMLDALRDHSNQPVWEHVDARYRPVIAGLARRLGVRDTDADEVAQQTLTEFVRAYRDGRYDREKGRLSSWILGIAHHTALKSLREGRRGGPRAELPTDEFAAVDTGAEHELRSIWTEERDRAIVDTAVQLLREESSLDDRTLMAFELVALRGVPPAEVARQTGLSVDQVYVAKSRVTKRLRELVATLTAAFEEDA